MIDLRSFVRRALGLAAIAALLAMLTACSDSTGPAIRASASDGVAQMTLYRSPDCTCCHQWAAIAQAAGWTIETVEVPDLVAIRARLGVTESAASCHTATIGDYFVEGHVPLEAIDRLLAERPSIDGIALPGMPSGSPGMGGVREGRFEVLAISAGEATPFGSY
jgi:hypothetical protein